MESKNIVQKIEGEYEVDKSGHLDLPRSVLRNLVDFRASRLPFEFDKGQTIIFLPTKFTEKDLELYNQEVVYQNRKLIQYSKRKGVIRFYFKSSLHLRDYYPHNTRVYLVRRHAQEIGVIEEETVFLAFEFSEKIIPKEIETKITESKVLYISKFLTPAMKENLNALDNYIILPVHSLKNLHHPDFRESYDILITFDPKFINTIDAQRFKNIDPRQFKELIKGVSRQKLEFRFLLDLDRLAEFFSDRREIKAKLIYIDDVNILITKDSSLQVPDKINLLDLEIYHNHKIGLLKFKTEYKKICGSDLPITSDDTRFFKDALLEVSLYSARQVTSEIVHKVYWYYWALKTNLKDYTDKHEILKIELFYLYISRVFAIYYAFKQYYIDNPLIEPKIKKALYSFFDDLSSDRIDLLAWLSTKIKRDKNLDDLIPITELIVMRYLDFLLEKMLNVLETKEER